MSGHTLRDLDLEAALEVARQVKRQRWIARLLAVFWPWPTFTMLSVVMAQRNRLAAELEEYERAALKAGFEFQDDLTRGQEGERDAR